MTPGINTAKKAEISYKVHEYSHDPSNISYGAEAAEKMGVPEERVFKTLVVSLDGKELAVGVVPVSSKLNMKLIAKAAGAKEEIENTGALINGTVFHHFRERRAPGLGNRAKAG